MFCLPVKITFPLAENPDENTQDLPPFLLIRDFGKRNTHGNVSKISVSLACYRQVGSKSTNHSPLASRKEGRKVTLVAVIGGFRSDLSITCKTDGNLGNVSAGVLFSKVAYNENGGKCLNSFPKACRPFSSGKS